MEPLHRLYIDSGEIISTSDNIEKIRAARDRDLDSLDSGVKRMKNPHISHVSLSRRLWELKRQMVSSY